MSSANVIDRGEAARLALELRTSFSGDVLLPGQPEYDEARTISKAMVPEQREDALMSCFYLHTVKLQRHVVEHRGGDGDG